MTSVVLIKSGAPAQDAIRYSLAGDAAIEAHRAAMENAPYTIKSGDFRLLVTPSVGLDWNDNVNINNQDPQQDVILRPMLQLRASYPLPERNLLTFDTGIGYDYYFDHNNYSGVRVQSGSQVAFDFYVKDFRIDVHDRFSYTQDSSGVSALYGTAQFGNLQNMAGLSVDWDLEDVVLTVGYDHLNYFVESDQYQYIDHSSEIGLVRAGFRVHPKATVGVEGTISSTSYDQPVLNDYMNYSGGIFADWRPGSAISIQPRFGYTVYDYQQTSVFILAQNQTSWYADLTIQHAITKSITYSLSAGHELRPGLQADIIDVWYARSAINWQIVNRVALSPSLSYEHGSQSAHGFSGAASEVYDWFGGGLSLGYSFVKNLTAELHYRFTIRGSDQIDRGYTQNVVGIQLTYAPR